MKLVTRLVILIIFCAVEFQGVAAAQVGSVTISGRVFDPNAASIVEATVEARNLDTGVSTIVKTNMIGSYSFVGLSPGRYNISVSKIGFKEILKSALELHTADRLSLNFTMDVGSVKETVTVSSEAEQLPTDNSAVGVLVNRDFVENTPLNGRSFQDLISLAPGTVMTSAGLASVNGQRLESNYFTVDGVAANVDPNVTFAFQDAFLFGLSGSYPAQTALGTTQALASVDSLQEFKVQTSGYAAEYGRQPGGQIAITTRSGSNDLHGSLFDYIRNDKLDANDWLSDFQGLPKQAERQNDFGGTIGGPLVIPDLHNGKDKTFYFVSYEGLRLVQPQQATVVNVPSKALRQFAAPGAQSLLNAWPLPTGPANNDTCATSVNPADSFGCSAQFAANWSNPSAIDAFSARLDQMAGTKTQLFLRYARTTSDAQTRQLSNLTSTNLNNSTVTFGATIRLTAAMTDELRFNYTSDDGVVTTTETNFYGAIPFAKSSLVPPQFVSPGEESEAIFYSPIQGATISSSFFMPQYSSNRINVRQYNLSDGLTWINHEHTLKFGADYRRLFPLFNPVDYFAEPVINSISSVQQGLADFLAVSQTQSARPVFDNLSIYAQDQWRVGRRLTLTYGLRWELNPAPGASNGIYPLALTTSDLSLAQLASKGTPEYRTSYTNFAPRLGFAYDLRPSSTHSTIVRGGGGIFYDTGQTLGAQGYEGYPFSANNLLQGVALPASVSALTPPSLNVPITPPYGTLGGAMSPNLRLPYTESWNLSLDQGVTPGDTLSVSYVGNRGRRLLFTQLYGQFGSPLPINPSFTQVYLTTNSSFSAYDGLQVQNQGHITTHLQVVASYTWSHAIDNASAAYTQFQPLRGNSDNDTRQLLNAALNYEIVGNEGNRFIRDLARGWTIDNRFFAQSGGPIDVQQGTYVLSNGQAAYIRPDLIPGVPIVLHVSTPGVLGGWELNPAAFNMVPTNPDGSPVRLGTLGRNYIHGPNFWSLNTGVQRNFRLYDRLHLFLRLEAFNIFNHPNPGNVDNFLPDGPGFFGTSRSAATFGVPNSLYATGGPRSLQAMIKMEF